MDEEEGKIVQEFLMLVERSQQLFSGLRDLPQYGHRYWQPYFDKTFGVYTKLWKFQQDHRKVLENKDRYGLKRYEIGEIASKIGQLYYHFYLRTSETNYLYEAFLFYDAIRKRGYFRDVLSAHSQVLMIKKLRYYARFIVVCLLLNMRDVVRDLLTELDSLVDQYTKTFNPIDAGEWLLVLQEIIAFLHADSPVVIANRPQGPLPSFRLRDASHVKIVERKPSSSRPRFHLQEAILVGHTAAQDKFSELTLDMFRFLQVLERDPSVGAAGGSDGSTSGSTGGVAAPVAVEANAEGGAAGGAAGGAGSKAGVSDESEKLAKKRSNPHKYLLYQPGFGTFMTVLSTCFKELRGDASFLLIYLSVDGIDPPAGDYGTNRWPGYLSGAVVLSALGHDESHHHHSSAHFSSSAITDTVHNNNNNSNNEAKKEGDDDPSATSDGDNKKDASGKENDTAAAAASGAAGGGGEEGTGSGANNSHGAKHKSSTKKGEWLHPGDIVPFTRRPLFLIVDSDKSASFADIPNIFGQPFIRLLSPSSKPSDVKELQYTGNLFTLFLYSPLTAFCRVVGLGQLEAPIFDEATRLLLGKFQEISEQFQTEQEVAEDLRVCMDDEFLSLLLLRFVFCQAVLSHHKKFSAKLEYLPQILPRLPSVIGKGLQATSLVATLATMLGVAPLFQF